MENNTKEMDNNAKEVDDNIKEVGYTTKGRNMAQTTDTMLVSSQ